MRCSQDWPFGWKGKASQSKYDAHVNKPQSVFLKAKLYKNPALWFLWRHQLRSWGAEDSWNHGMGTYHKHTIIMMIKTYYWPCITIISRQPVRAGTRTPSWAALSLWDRYRDRSPSHSPGNPFIIPIPPRDSPTCMHIFKTGSARLRPEHVINT